MPFPFAPPLFTSFCKTDSVSPDFSVVRLASVAPGVLVTSVTLLDTLDKVSLVAVSCIAFVSPDFSVVPLVSVAPGVFESAVTILDTLDTVSPVVVLFAACIVLDTSKIKRKYM